MTEFFHENATLAIEVDLGEGMRKFCKSGVASLVPRPRPLSREKGSGDLRPIPRSSLS